MPGLKYKKQATQETHHQVLEKRLGVWLLNTINEHPVAPGGANDSDASLHWEPSSSAVGGLHIPHLQKDYGEEQHEPFRGMWRVGSRDGGNGQGKQGWEANSFFFSSFFFEVKSSFIFYSGYHYLIYWKDKDEATTDKDARNVHLIDIALH